jgi:hypothetical protein
MKLKPWYEVVKPRADLREGKPLDAGEFAVHLDKVRDGRAQKDYQDPEQFFAKTFLANNLLDLSSQVVRRLSGETSQTSALYNLATQFGGGKTHALTLLYHLGLGGSKAKNWIGVPQILERAQVPIIPEAHVAVFVGTEFDSITGRGGSDGTPQRFTPWGEIAFQLGGAEGFQHVAKHDAERIAPGGDVIRQFLPKDKPNLILMDELMNYVSRFRAAGLGSQLYNFLLNLSNSLDDKSVLVISVPASELEMTAEDEGDYNRLTKMLNRVGKAISMTAGSESSEIIRRRLFEWDLKAVDANGRVILNRDAISTCQDYSQWVIDNESQLPGTISAGESRKAFEQSYPFHPTVLSVFERKWQTVPKFQQTRGILKMLAIWVSLAYESGFKKVHKDPLITLGTAPLDNTIFRAEVFEQLGNRQLEGAVTTDIAGLPNSHAVRLDAEALEAIKTTRLHQKAATSVFFESNGGTVKAEATEPEIRLAVGEPTVDIGNVETVLEALTDASYYLLVERKNYRFSIKENLNKRFVDRKATIQVSQIDQEVKGEILRLFKKKEFYEVVQFPDKTISVSDRPILTFVVGDLNRTLDDEKQTLPFIEQVVKDCGSSARTYKSAVIWIVADSAHSMREEARKLLAWNAIKEESFDLKLDDAQKAQLAENVKKAERDLKEAIWRSYKHVLLLAKDNTIRRVDLGLVHSSSADSPLTNVINRLSADGDIEKGVSHNFLLRNWPPAFTEWSTKSVRDAFYASPVFPRVLQGDSIKDTISKGVSAGLMGYVSKKSDGTYSQLIFKQSLLTGDVEISDDVFIVTKETAEKYLAGKPEPVKPDFTLTPDGPAPSDGTPAGNGSTIPSGSGGAQPPAPTPPTNAVSRLEWSGELSAQKWMNFYTKVVSKFATTPGIKLTVKFEANPPGGVSHQKVEETRSALKELGLDGDNLKSE